MNTGSSSRIRTARRIKAFTLAEVCISAAISAMVISGIVYGYTMTARRAEWSGYSLAAHANAIQIIERARGAKWDPRADPPVDTLITNNFPKEVVVLDMPVKGTNAVYATNTITITTVSVSPPLKMIRVETSWKFSVNNKAYTNTVVAYRTPET